MSLLTSVVFIIQRNGGVYLVKNEVDGLWTLPGGKPWENCASFTDFARVCLFSYFNELSVDSLELLISPEEKITLGNECARCSVFICKINGDPREDMKDKIWLAGMPTLVNQVLTPDIRCIVNHREVQSRLE